MVRQLLIGYMYVSEAFVLKVSNWYSILKTFESLLFQITHSASE